MYRRGEKFRPRVTRLRLLRGGWGLFTAESVTLGDDLEPDEPGLSRVGSVVYQTEILDLDDEDAQTGLPYGRERLN